MRWARWLMIRSTLFARSASNIITFISSFKLILFHCLWTINRLNTQYFIEGLIALKHWIIGVLICCVYLLDLNLWFMSFIIWLLAFILFDIININKKIYTVVSLLNFFYGGNFSVSCKWDFLISRARLLSFLTRSS